MGHRPAVVLSLILLVVAGTARAGEGAPVNTWTGAAPSGACRGSRVATVATTGQSYCCVSSTWQPCGRESERVSSPDTRSVADAPQAFLPGAEFDFKANATDGLSDGNVYHGVLTFRPYGTGTDLSGGPVHQLGFTANGNLWRRISTSATTWGAWTKVNDTAGDILSKLLGVDGAGSGLDADLLDGLHANAFALLASEPYFTGPAVNVMPPSGLAYLRLYNQGIAGAEKRSLQIEGGATEVGYWSPAALPHRFYSKVIAPFFDTGATTGGKYYAYDAGAGTRNGMGVDGAGLIFFTNGNTTFKVGGEPSGTSVGMLDGVGNWTVTGNITAYGSVSDARLKRDVEPISGALAKALSLRGVEYDWREELLSAAGFNPTRGRVTGLIAQDVQRVLPDAVYEARGQDGETYLGVRYERVVPLLLEAIRELNAKVERLEARQ